MRSPKKGCHNLSGGLIDASVNVDVSIEDAAQPNTSISAVLSSVFALEGVDTPNVLSDEIVLPPTTSSGETICKTECVSESPEVIYSSLPPDLNVDALLRATRTSVNGESFIVDRVDGKLKITLKDPTTPTMLFENSENWECVCCNRVIEASELHLHFPDDLDRRRLWGNMLGFKYSEMLKMKFGSKCTVASAGVICTDHFSEECFRKFNFNKAAIEAFGIPVPVSPVTQFSPSKKRAPWECTICNFRTLSVADMHFHLLAHISVGVESNEIRVLLTGKGLACPFCRKCTYGYKTLSGFSRHLILEPTTHFYLKRIYEVAKTNFRSSVLNPPNQWISWTERNVYFAYHGCEPPVKSPTKKRPLNGSSPVKNLLSSPKDVSTNSALAVRNVISSSLASTSGVSDIVEFEASNTREEQRCDDSSVPLVRNTFRKYIPTEYPRVDVIRKRQFDQDELNVGDKECIERVPSSKRMASSQNFESLEHGSTIADVLNDVAVEDRPEEGLALISETALRPPVTTSGTVSDHRYLRAIRRKTQRQLESNEARLRLFGDATYVEVPKGYRKIETARGLRLVSAVPKDKTWEEQMAPVMNANRRFLPVHRMDQF